ncbi:hypothetical protein MNV49_001566 [Pseudohyphozyma bogoriensis]|nr:hypothetical protein MNV49_001566 [Pseudohyphozyma bogoriensis]
MAKQQPVSDDDSEEYSSDDDVSSKVDKGKGKASAKKVTSGAAPGKPGKDGDKEIRRRSSKACDNCRKSKCKCTRVIDPATNQPIGPCDNCRATNSECKFEGTTRKRGPPKGYIEAIESRLHRMEALLGGLLQSDDPRAQALLEELIGDDEAREILTQDLKAASTAEATGQKPRKSWTKLDANKPGITPSVTGPIVSRGFGGVGIASPPAPGPMSGVVGSRDGWAFNEDDLGLGGSGASGGSPSDVQNIYGGIDIPISGAHASSSTPHSHSLPTHLSSSAHLSPTAYTPSNLSNTPNPSSGPNPRRRKLSTATAGAGGNTPTPFSFSGAKQGGLAAGSINHTGQSSYSLSKDAALSPGAEDEKVVMTELADVVGQLSLNENAEVRYHGRSSGLYLISKSARYKDFFWQFPSAGVWPPSEDQVPKTEREILGIREDQDPLPDRATQQHLLDLYWTYVHPHFPILYKESFMKQYRHSLSNPDSREPSTPSGSGKVPIVLLLSMFALAARYSDLEPTPADGKFWAAGQGYLEQARKVLNYDYGSSKLVTVQALLLMAYREIGTGAMSASWLFTGMAIRMAQDLGLFRDVEKWYLPVQRFSHEEKQTRKRVWWGCIILDRYTSSYIGRPGTIHERDYDTSFPSEDEPDENEQWKPLRPDGTHWSSPPKPGSEAIRVNLTRYPNTKAHTMSCFNAAGALAVIINRIIINIYAIRIRVLGQSSDTLLSLLDQSLASWYLALPAHLTFDPTSKKVPPPHVLSLHLQFYSALILLHRPFIPGQSSDTSPSHFPSHSICTTSANAIASIITTFSKTFTLRQCPPFLVYPIFNAAVICVYNAGFDEALARPAKIYLSQCMAALKEMEVVWAGAIRQWDLLNGLVDLRDADLSAELQMMNGNPDAARGTKRAAEFDEGVGASAGMPMAAFDNVPPTNFHSRPLAPVGAAKRPASTAVGLTSMSTLPEAPPLNSTNVEAGGPSAPDQAFLDFLGGSNSAFNVDRTPHSYDLLQGGAQLPDLQYQSGVGTGSYEPMLKTTYWELGSQVPQTPAAGGDPAIFQNGGNAFFSMPMGGAPLEEWADYATNGFGLDGFPGQGESPAGGH